MKILKGLEIVGICDKTLGLWHKNGKKMEQSSLDEALLLLNFKKTGPGKLVNDSIVINCFLWHLEDRARAKSFSDSVIANIKRAIDLTNQRRNNKMEEIDAALLKILAEKNLKPKKNAGLNSETPGSIADRLAIISLKIYHMREQSRRRDAKKEHREKCKARLAVLLEQRRDLSGSLDALLKELLKGRKKLKMYFQFKMYNDPATNPFMKK